MYFLQSHIKIDRLFNQHFDVKFPKSMFSFKIIMVVGYIVPFIFILSYTVNIIYRKKLFLVVFVLVFWDFYLQLHMHNV